ncbi:MAG: lipopolysaccharide assembly protein LapA domain-containing protein [Paracoccaceae bacterium]
MVRYLRYLFLAALAIVLVSIALANRDPVTLRLMTDDLAALAGVPNAATLPLFLVIFAGIIGGILIGFVWEWLREHKHRAEAASQRRERERLQREVDRLQKKSGEVKDDVLALLEG